MKRILCIWLPCWPIQRRRAAQPELARQPLVLFAAGRRGKKVVIHGSAEAAQRGIAPGMPLAEAKALTRLAPADSMRARNDEPGNQVHFEPYDPQADRAALRHLALACQQFGPYAALEEADAPDCLFVDVTGCGPIFHGEAALAKQARLMLHRRGYAARLAIADTMGAAWAFAHAAADEISVVPPGQHPAALRTLPVEALRLAPETVALFYALDLRRIEQLLDLPRAELPARFGLEVIKRLDQALGQRPELFTPETFAELPEATWELEYPTSERRVIDAVLEQLLGQVLEKLQPCQFGVQRLLGTLRLLNAEPVRFQVGLLHASASSGHLLDLLRLQAERLQLPAEVIAITLRVVQAGSLEFRQAQMFADAGRPQQHEQFPALVERLSNRLGEQAVLCPRLWPDAQPELAWRYEPWLRPSRQPRTDRIPAMRPPCLKTRPIAVPVVSVVPEGPPVRFEWQHNSHVVAQWWGPERIETGWWRERDVRRDYYLVETTTGAQFWLFRALEPATWFLQGSY